jgi:hypothetical protein
MLVLYAAGMAGLPSVSGAEGAKNLLVNSSFEEGRDQWRLDKGGSTEVQFTIDRAEAAAGQNSAVLHVGAVAEWGVQFGQSLDPPVLHKTYSFAAMARSLGTPVKVRLAIERRGKPYDRAAASEPVLLTSDAWQELHVTFQVSKPFPEGWFAYLNCTQADAKFRVDAFRLYEGEFVPYADAAREELAAAAVHLFDTGSSSAAPYSAAQITAKADWNSVPEDVVDHAFRGDTVVANDRLALVLHRGSPRTELWSRSSGGWQRRAELAPSMGQPAVKTAAVDIVDNSPAEVVVEVRSENAEGAVFGVRYGLGMGQLFVTTQPTHKTESLSITAPCRFAVLPDFFADDIVVDATELRGETAELPSENFLLQMLPGGEAIVMSVADVRSQDVRIAISGRGEQRVIDRSEISYGPKGQVWVAVLEGQGIWHEHAVAAEDAGQIIPLQWKAPYPAQWRVDWQRPDRLTDSWEMAAQRSSGEFEKYGWAEEPNLIPKDRKRWTTVLGTFTYPCWYDQSGQGYLQPLKRVTQFAGPALIYPIKRVRATPLSEFTVVDVVRATLGVGPCEYILDVEGQGSHYKGRATCATRDALAEIYGRQQQRQKKEEVEKILQDVVVFVKHIRGRIEDYIRFGHDLRVYLQDQKKAHPELGTVIAELEAITHVIDAHFENRRESIKTPEYVMELTEKFRQTLLDYEGDDALARCNAITHAIVDVGGNQDELVGECRMVVKVLRQRAGLIVAREPKAADLASEIRTRSQQVLRNPAGHESARH